MGERYKNWAADQHELTEGFGGAEFVTCGAFAMGPIYNDGTYKYFGEAKPGTLESAEEWRVSRMNILTKQIQWADGNGNFDNAYTDETHVTTVITYL